MGKEGTTIVKLAAAIGRPATWSAETDFYAIVLLKERERTGEIHELRCQLVEERDIIGNIKPDQPRYCECRLVRLPNHAVVVEVEPPRTRFGFIMQRPDGERVVVGDISLWDFDGRPLCRVQSYADYEAEFTPASTLPTP